MVVYCVNTAYYRGENMNFSEGIKYIRKTAYLSQESFAKEIEVSFSTVNRWERGKSKPNYAAMKKINAFCNANSIKYHLHQNQP